MAGKALILILILKSGSSGRTKGRGWRGMVGPESSDIKHHMGIQALLILRVHYHSLSYLNFFLSA